MIWEKPVQRQELESLKKQYALISSRLSKGLNVARVLAEQCPGEGFTQVQPQLEDAYFAVLKQHQDKSASQRH